MELADNLNVRFNIAIQSSSELEFYQNLYHYFDFIHKTPELLAIFEASEIEYTKAHSALWRKKMVTDEEIDEAAAQTTKLEKFNLFAVGSGIYVRIYLPIDYYRNSKESDRDQDIIAVILMRGAGYAASLKKWSKDDIKGYIRWFDGKRDYYEKQLRQFHLIFLEELPKPVPRVQVKVEAATIKSGIYYNPVTGKGWFKDKDFTFKDHQPEFRLFAKLYEHIGETIKREEILTITGIPEGKLTTYDINALIKKIRTRTKLNMRELVQNNGNITLIGHKLEDFPNHP